MYSTLHDFNSLSEILYIIFGQMHNSMTKYLCIHILKRIAVKATKVVFNFQLIRRALKVLNHLTQ
jgi:hypothetical protein